MVLRKTNISVCEWCSQMFEGNNKFCCEEHKIENKSWLDKQQYKAKRRSISHLDNIAVFVSGGEYDQKTATITFKDGSKYKIVKV